jgi:hypothetical protein
MASKSTAAERARPVAEPATLALVAVAAWLVPGAGHLWLGKVQKGVVFLVCLTTLFVLGLLLQGRLFPFDTSELLVALAAVANAGLGLPWIIGRTLGLGAGVVTAQTYEYGNSFLIVAGLLNFLVILDAYDTAAGRK